MMSNIITMYFDLKRQKFGPLLLLCFFCAQNDVLGIQTTPDFFFFFFGAVL